MYYGLFMMQANESLIRVHLTNCYWQSIQSTASSMN